MKALIALTKIELKLAFREISGVLFITLLPVSLLILYGFLNGNIQDSFPALLTIGIIATGLMGVPLAISEYRSKKILKRLRVTPLNPLIILLSQGLSSLIFTFLSAIALGIVAVLIYEYRIQGSVVMFQVSYLLTLVSMYALGFLLASVTHNAKSSNALSSMVYFPMLLLSGATIPFEMLPKGLQYISCLLPLTHGIRLLKASSLNITMENAIISQMYLCILTVVSIVVSIKTFKWE